MKLSRQMYDTRERSAAARLSALEALVRSMPPRPPIGGVIPTSIDAKTLAGDFDPSGVGLSTGNYHGWAIANGEDDRPDVDLSALTPNDLVPLVWVGAGG